MIEACREVVGVLEVNDEVSPLEEDLFAELAWQHLGVHLRIKVVLLLVLDLGLRPYLTVEDRGPPKAEASFLSRLADLGSIFLPPKPHG